MKATFKATLVAATLVTASIAHAGVTPAQQAGLCAANAMRVNQWAQGRPGMQKLAALSDAQVARDFGPFKNQPGFREAAQWEAAQDLTIEQRVKIADGCTSIGY